MTTTRPRGHEPALRLLARDPEVLETGLVTLDTELDLSESVSVDLLAADGLGYPVAVLFCDDDASAAVGRMAHIAAGLRQGRPLLDRLYGKQGLDAALPPRFVLLAKRFADHVPAMLDLLGATEVRALEYRVHGDDGGRLELMPFHRGRSASAVAALAPDPAPVVEPPAPRTAARDHEPHVEVSRGHEHDTDDIVIGASNGRASAHAGVDPLGDLAVSEPTRALFQRARDSIRSLSGQLVEHGEPGKLSFHVGDQHLATLHVDTTGLEVAVGGERGLAVDDDEAFNASLNAVFTHYFDELSGRP